MRDPQTFSDAARELRASLVVLFDAISRAFVADRLRLSRWIKKLFNKKPDA